MSIDILEEVKNSKIVNGVLSLSAVSPERVHEFRTKLREDILLARVPHYRAIGVRVDGVRKADIVSKPSGVNKSYTELFAALRDVVLAEGDAGVASIEEKIYYNNMEVLQGSEKGCSFLKAINEDVNSSNGSIFYMNGGLSMKARMLVKNIDIIRLQNLSASLNLVIRKDTGLHDFSETGKDLRNTDYVPLRAVYDLNNIICVSGYDDGSTDVKFMYKRDVDEDVLYKIVLDYIENEGV